MSYLKTGVAAGAFIFIWMHTLALLGVDTDVWDALWVGLAFGLLRAGLGHFDD